jgi:hypothetical protein
MSGYFWPDWYLIGGVGFATLMRGGPPWKRPLAGVLAAWCGLAAVGIHPDQLSYFNEAACLTEDPRQIGFDGGSRCGPSWLDDSNVDWGQGLKQLKAWTDAHAKDRSVRLEYFGSFPPDAYEIRYDLVPDKDLETEHPPPGLYAISTHIFAHMGAVVDLQGSGRYWPRNTRPIDLVGHAFYIYEIPPRTAGGRSPKPAAGIFRRVTRRAGRRQA